MTKRDELLALAERCEKVSEGSRELDAEIYAAINGGRPSHDFTEDNPASRLRHSYGKGIVFDHSDPWTNGGHVLQSMVVNAPLWTTSLDAAMTLVPEGCGWLVANGRTRPDEPLGGARVTSLDGETVIAEAEAATPELALCGAALRAAAEIGA